MPCYLSHTTDPCIKSYVSVHSPDRAGKSDGGGLPRNAASPAATRNANSGRPCWRQDATIVSSRSANRLPASLAEPKLPLPPQHGRPQGALRHVVGRLDVSHPPKGPQGRPPLRQL